MPESGIISTTLRASSQIRFPFPNGFFHRKTPESGCLARVSNAWSAGFKPLYKTGFILLMIIPCTVLQKKKLRSAVLSPFSRSYRDRHEINNLAPEIAIAYAHGVTTPDGRIFYLKNAKCGCTTISQMLHTYIFGAPFPGNIHQSDALPLGLRHFRLHRAAIANSEAVKFSFVRHPFSRLKSAFCDFFVDDRRNPQALRHWDNMLALGFKPGGDINYNFDVFLHYVGLNLERAELHCDEHWRPQFISLGSGKIAYDKIGRFENFSADLKEIFSNAGLPLLVALVERKMTFNQSSNETRDDLTISRAQASKIRSLYAMDFEAYGYE